MESDFLAQACGLIPVIVPACITAIITELICFYIHRKRKREDGYEDNKVNSDIQIARDSILSANASELQSFYDSKDICYHLEFNQSGKGIAEGKKEGQRGFSYHSIQASYKETTLDTIEMHRKNIALTLENNSTYSISLIRYFLRKEKELIEIKTTRVVRPGKTIHIFFSAQWQMEKFYIDHNSIIFQYMLNDRTIRRYLKPAPLRIDKITRKGRKGKGGRSKV